MSTPVVPPTAVPPFPAPGDPAYNAKAYAWAMHMAGVFPPEMQSLANSSLGNATAAEQAAADADADAVAAMGYRNVANAAAAQTTADKAVTTADRAQTTIDKGVTAADRLQTGQDRTATGQDRNAAAASAASIAGGPIAANFTTFPDSAALDGTEVVVLNQPVGTVKRATLQKVLDWALARLNVWTGSQRHGVTALAANSLAINCSSGNAFSASVAANSTQSFSNLPAGTTDTTIKLTIVHTGGTITWDASVRWPGGIAPSLITNRIHVIFLTRIAGVWRGSGLVNYANEA